MTRKDALAELIAKVEAGEDAGVKKASSAIASSARDAGQYWPHHDILKAYFHGSLDAAMALGEAVLPGWFAGVSENIYGHGWHGWVQTHERSVDANSDSPARALLLAGLRALHSMEPDDQTP